MHRHVCELFVATMVALVVSAGPAAASDVDAQTDAPALQHTDDILPDEVERRGAYVRLDVGGMWSPAPGISVVNAPAGLGAVDAGTPDAQVSVGGGVGYRFSNWFRSDLTVAFAPGRDFTADTSGSAGSGALSGSMTSTALLASAYAEFAPESWVRPYVGGGLGVANLSLDSVEQQMPGGGTTAFSDNSEWNLAWSLAAGVTLDVSEALELDAGYRYINFGDARTGTGSNGSHVTLDGVDGHEVRFGIRYLFR